jgi:hypothetical protein
MHANVALATGFFPRFLKSFWPQLCRSTLSNRLVEPFALDGSFPLLSRFYGTLKSYGLASWSYDSPNLLFKNLEIIDREQFEMDQTGTVIKRTAQCGMRVAQGVDYLLAKRILTADLSSSASTVYKNSTYYTTFESNATTQIPLFSSAHNMYSGSNQSNIITGGLPAAATVASIAQNDIAAMAQIVIRDFTLLVDRIASIVDDKGAQMFPDFDPAESLVIVGPPALREVFDYAFAVNVPTSALIGGSPSTSTGSTGSLSIGKKRVKKVLTPGLLRGCIDIEDETGTVTVSPQYATQYYAFIEDDYVAPFYFQRFRPMQSGEFSPPGSNPDAEVEAAIAAAEIAGLRATTEAADMYAATEVLSNLSALGDNAQLSVAVDDAFFISGRTRFNINYGFWPTAYKIDPSGASS